MRRLVLLVAASLLVAGCGGVASRHDGGTVQVVAAENFWGSIAGQLGGDRVHCASLITNPATDPHAYEPTAADARALAGAKLVVVNGIGYDAWASKLLVANPADGREVVTVGDLVGLKPGDNPHQWYSPSTVERVIDAIASRYAKLDPKHAAYYARRKRDFEKRRLSAYKQEIDTIRRRYAGVPVGASESIFAPLAEALRLRLVTPHSFLKAISEGTDPSAADVATVDRQVARKQIAVWVYNSQNATPDIARVTAAARGRGIPVATVTETLSPATATFQAWQTAQLRALAAALAGATGR